MVTATTGQNNTRLLQTNPYGMVFDYPNASIPRHWCDTAFKNLADKVFAIYKQDIIATTNYTFNADGFLVPKSGSRRLTTCTLKQCADTTQLLVTYGCNNCKRRLLREDNKDIDVRAKQLTGRRDQTTSTDGDLDWLKSCRTTMCNYDKNTTKELYQGWNGKLVKTRGAKVAAAFYQEATKTGNSLCNKVLPTMTHWVYPIECA